MAGPEGVPVPVSTTDCGLSPALSLMVSAPVRVPAVVGVNVTLMLQDEPAARVEAQELEEIAKSPFTTVFWRLMLRTSLPTLEMTTVWAVLGVPTA